MSDELTNKDIGTGCVVFFVPTVFLLLWLAWKLYFQGVFSPW